MSKEISGIDRATFLAFCEKLLIPGKEGEETGGRALVPLIPMRTQLYVLDEILKGLARGIHFFVVLKCRQCLSGSTRILTSDLRWVPICDVPIGQEIVAFDEYSPGPNQARRMRTAKVLDRWEINRTAYKLTFSNGVSYTAGANHPILCKRRFSVDTQWRAVSNLKVGDQVRVICEPWGPMSPEDGWMGGIIDGEGSLRRIGKAEENKRCGIGVSQRKGVVLDAIYDYFLKNGYHIRNQMDSRAPVSSSKFGSLPVDKVEVCRSNDCFRLLGKTRPKRFIGIPWWEGHELPGKKSGYGWVELESIECVGEQPLIDLETSTGTFIAEGQCHHNSGITTLGLAFDLYWCFRHDGVIFNFIADNSKRTNYNRSLLRDFVKSLSKTPEWRQPIDDDNRDMISFGNRSKIIWNNANGRDEGGLGRGTGVVGCHGTEVGLWKDEEGAGSLLSSLAQRNPNRFYLWEGTAQGPGLFREMCREAERTGNTTQKFIFVGWWLQPDYDLDLKTPEGLERYNVYWKTFPRPDKEEALRVDAVNRRYGWKVTSTQLGWWRWHLK
jgi:hypothetical protein